MIASTLGWFFISALGVGGAPQPTFVEQPAARPDDPIEPDRDGLYCGVQAVCLISHLYGRPMEFERALAQIPVTARGSSLASMKRCLVSRGLDFETVIATPALLDNVTRPFIAHLGSAHGNQSGHYVVVLAADRGELLMVDPSSKVYAVTNTATFSSQWSGYALVPTASLPRSLGIGWPRALIVACTVVATGLLLLRARRLQARKNASIKLCILATSFALTAWGCSGNAAPRGVGVRTIGASTADLGLILPGNTGEHSFQIRNEGAGDVELSLGEVSCGCAKAELQANRIRPGQSTATRLQVRAGRPGPKNASATILCTAANSQTDSLAIQVQAVVCGLEVKPEVVRVSSSGSATDLVGTGLVELYTDDANDINLLSFEDVSDEGTEVPLRCDFGEPEAHVLDEGTHLSIPMSLKLEASRSTPPPAHYRSCRLSVGASGEKFHLSFLVWVDSPADYRVIPQALVLRVRSVAHGGAGAATLRVQPREGFPEIDSLTATCDVPSIAVDVRGSSIQVEYNGPVLQKPMSTTLVLSSPRFRNGHEEVPLLLLASR